MRPVCVDLVDWEKTDSAVKSLGHLDFLVNIAGIVAHAPLLDVTSDSFDGQVVVSLT